MDSLGPGTINLWVFVDNFGSFTLTWMTRRPPNIQIKKKYTQAEILFKKLPPKCVSETRSLRLPSFLSLFIIRDSIRERERGNRPTTTMKPFIDITYAAGHRRARRRTAMRRYSSKGGHHMWRPHKMVTEGKKYPFCRQVNLYSFDRGSPKKGTLDMESPRLRREGNEFLILLPIV